jgi:hypothetical protein
VSLSFVVKRESLRHSSNDRYRGDVILTASSPLASLGECPALTSSRSRSRGERARAFASAVTLSRLGVRLPDSSNATRLVDTLARAARARCDNPVLSRSSRRICPKDRLAVGRRRFILDENLLELCFRVHIYIVITVLTICNQ